MNHTIRWVVAGSCALATACSAHGPQPGTNASPPFAASDEPSAMQGMSHEHGGMSMLPATAGPGYTVADVQFMQGMIGHHAQAVDMSALAPTRGAGEAVSKLAEKIDISQRDEIKLMRGWLQERGQAVPTDEQAHAMRMPGMLTPDQMAELAAARGPEFDRLYLTRMIMHHRGALTMVDTLFAYPGAGQDPDLFRFVTDVGADQRDEIWVMQTMLDAMDTNRGSRSR